MNRKQRLAPAVGEVWASPCTFMWREDGSGLKPGGGRNEEGDYIPGDILGVEERTVVAVVDIPGYQRRVTYTRRFLPDGHEAFGRPDLRMIGLGAFNLWRNGRRNRYSKPAMKVTPSHVETALQAIRERVAA